MSSKNLIPGCGNVTYNAVGDVSYLLFTNLHLNAHPLRNEFVIYETEALLIALMETVDYRRLYCTSQTWFACKLFSSAEVRILESNPPCR
jgi:hypothetical protein